ncbi:MAG: hypothetical protein M3N47_08050 [Chloroflexota bacterium]|nr:hypothetical protein [Chloroflexota bacterium]
MLYRDLARWWRQREGLRIDDHGPVEGQTGFDATVAYTGERKGRFMAEP